MGLMLLLALTVSALPVSAQEFRGTVAGRVTDSSGAVIQGATVTIKNVQTNVTTSATTNDDGGYNLSFLLPGTYTLSVSMQGFKTAQRENVEVRVSDRLTLDISMEVGVVESITIVGASPLLDSSSATTGQLVSSRQINELPLADGTAYVLTNLAPGITYTGDPKFSRPADNANLAAFQSNGATGANQITLDGSPNLASQGRVGFSPPSDAVQEFKVETNNFDAQQGYTAGANVNVATKSGTNALHGSAYYFNRNENRAANDFFANRSLQGRSTRDYERYGGTVGGPVWIPGVYNGRDKSFFFFSYEGLYDISPEPQIFTVPTLKMREGDFSELLAQGVTIFDPFTGRRQGNTTLRSPLSCNGRPNVICANRINPISGRLINFYPKPNQPGLGGGTSNNYFSPQTRTYNYDGFLVRGDHLITQDQKIFAKFYWNNRIEDRNDYAGPIDGVEITRGFDFRDNIGGNLDYTATISPTLIVDIRASVSKFGESREPAETFDLAELGFSPEALALFGDYSYIPRFDIRNYAVLGARRSDFKEGFDRPFYVYSLQPTATHLRGAHTMRFGYDLRVLRENFVDEGYVAGRYQFDGLYTSAASNSPTAERNQLGRDLAAFLFGLPSANNNSFLDAPIAYSAQSVYHGFFFQDDWRVNSRLTLNMGVRYDVELGLTERHNRIVRGFDTNGVNPVEAAVRAAYAANPVPGLPANELNVRGGYIFADSNNRSMWNADKNNVQPRVGAAFKIDDKTVIRGGFGVFHAPFQVEANIINQAGFINPSLVIPTLDNAVSFVANLTSPLPQGRTPSLGSGLGLLTHTGRNLGITLAGANRPIVFSDERENARFWRVTAGIQRELPGKIVVDAMYVTAWGDDLAVQRPLNFVPEEFVSTTSRHFDPAAQAAQTFLTGTIPNPFRNLLPGSPLNTQTSIARSILLSRFPQFGTVDIQTYEGSNRYHSGQFQVQKRFDRSLSLSFAYTVSKLREQVTLLNGFDPELEERDSPADRPHRVAVSAVYELPFGRGRTFGSNWNRVLDIVAGGWQLQGTYEWQSGEPIVFNNNLFFNGDPDSVRSRVGEKDEKGQTFGIDLPGFDTSGFYFNDAAVQTNGVVDPVKQRSDPRIRLGIGNARYLPTTLPHVRNMPYSNANIGLSKNFRIREGMRVQLRAEALNAFNYGYFIFDGNAPDPTNANFGFINIQRNLPRDIQLGAKFVF